MLIYCFILFFAQWWLLKPFKNKRCIGDPMSPYLFVIGMKYLQRETDQLALNGNFNFHVRCRKLGASHICFADELLMLCRADLFPLKHLMLLFRNSHRHLDCKLIPIKVQSIWLASLVQNTKFCT